MAQKEAELSLQGNIKFMNMELVKHIDNRTLEAIKKVRHRPDYRQMVIDKIAALRRRANAPTPQSPPSQNSPTPSTSAQGASSDSSSCFLDFLQSLPAGPPTSPMHGQLQILANNAHEMGKEQISDHLNSLLTDYINANVKKHTGPRAPQIIAPTSKRKQRRMEYAMTQNNWRKHQGRCIKSILAGPDETRLPDKNIMSGFWRRVMTEHSLSTPGVDIERTQDLDGVWTPLTKAELLAKVPATSSSPGPDGISTAHLHQIGFDALMYLYNLILWTGIVPLPIRRAKTIFIPKTQTASRPEEYRPITVASLLIRHINAILAGRLVTGVSLDKRQRGFIKTDGCADNTTLLDLLIRQQHANFKSCAIAVLDVSKAFDSVSHNAIIDTLKSYGLPGDFVRYVRSIYSTGSTSLWGAGWSTEDFIPSRGVKQGDPLSPLFFNLVIDRLLHTLPDDVGANLGGSRVNCLAFADDLILCASTTRGLQLLLDKTADFLMSCGLTINADKSKTISIRGLGKEKKTLIQDTKFSIHGRPLPALSRVEKWKYLGIDFTPEGKTYLPPYQELSVRLERLTKAPLKPQQRLHALRTVVIPQLYHQVSLGNVRIGCLNKIDKITRHYVRRWTNLPNDVPVAYIHASIRDGGLGILAMRTLGPLLRMNRLANLELPGFEGEVEAISFIAKEIDMASRRLNMHNTNISTRKDMDQYWKTRLTGMCDGHGLREAGDVPNSHRWVREPTRLLSGHDFIMCLKTRINALPCLSRTSRGRPEKDRACRGGCQAQETNNHVLQQCHRTHAARIARHDSVVSYMARNLSNKSQKVWVESRYNTTIGLQKPDIVAIDKGVATILDVQVVTDSINTNQANRTKKIKYSNEPLHAKIREQNPEVKDIRVLPLTVNWRGVWSRDAASDLIAAKMIRKNELALISTRVLIGSYSCFKQFNRSTTTTIRAGIG